MDVRFAALLRFPSGVVAELASDLTAEHMSVELEKVADAVDGRASRLLGREDGLGRGPAIQSLCRSAEREHRVTLGESGESLSPVLSARTSHSIQGGS